MFLLYLHPAIRPPLHAGNALPTPAYDVPHDTIRDSYFFLDDGLAALRPVDAKRRAAPRPEDGAYGLGDIAALLLVDAAQLPSLLLVGICEQVFDELLSTFYAGGAPLEEDVEGLLVPGRGLVLVAPLPAYRNLDVSSRAGHKLPLLAPAGSDKKTNVIVAAVFVFCTGIICVSHQHHPQATARDDNVRKYEVS